MLGSRLPDACLDRLQRDALAWLQAREHLDRRLVARGAQAQLTQVRVVLRVDHVDGGHFAPAQHGGARHEQPWRLADDEVRALIDQGPFQPEDALRVGLIDEVAYEDELDDLIDDFADAGYVEADDYAQVSWEAAGVSRRSKIAVINAAGVINSGSSGFDPVNGAVVGADSLVEYIREARGDRSIRAIVLQNVRQPDLLWGDLQSQIASLNIGEASIQRLVAKLGEPRFERALKQLLDASEAGMRAVIGRIPDGTYAFEDRIDDDGITAEPIVIRAAVTVAGDESALQGLRGGIGVSRSRRDVSGLSLIRPSSPRRGTAAP